MALRFVIVLLAAVLAVAYGQNCISLGGSLLSSCSKELDALQSIYPLDSDSLPTADQLTSVDAKAKEESLPTSGCCAAAQSFDGASCQCDSTLPTLLGTLGLTSSTEGLKGYINLTRTLCDYTGSDC